MMMTKIVMVMVMSPEQLGATSGGNEGRDAIKGQGLRGCRRSSASYPPGAVIESASAASASKASQRGATMMERASVMTRWPCLVQGREGKEAQMEQQCQTGLRGAESPLEMRIMMPPPAAVVPLSSLYS